MSQDLPEPESTWPGYQTECPPGYDDQPQSASSHWTPQKRRIIAALAVLVLLVILGTSLWLVLVGKEHQYQQFDGLKMPSAVAQPIGNNPPQERKFGQPEASENRLRHTPPDKAAEIKDGAAAPAMADPDAQGIPQKVQEPSTPAPSSQRSAEVSQLFEQQFEAVNHQLKRLETKLKELADPAEGDRGTPGMATALQALTEDMQKLAKENEGLRNANRDLQEALGATEKRLDKLTQENARLSSMAQSKGKKEQKSPIALDEPKTKVPAEPVDRWSVMGLAANRVVIQDEKGNIHAVEAGKSLNGVKIISVDLINGDVKTSAGVISYLKK